MEIQDPLGNRIKSQYEDRTRYYLPRRTYTILRLDQKCGHTYTKGLNKPFDKGYMEDMDAAIVAMLPQIQGAVFAYTQSDECSILLTDFATPQTSAWFDNNIQKMTSVAASILTAEFNKLRTYRYCESISDRGLSSTAQPYVHLPRINNIPSAHFDCRCFSIPDRTEVMNYFRWREQDCIKNSTSMAAQSCYSPKELDGKHTADKHEMLHAKGINWATDFTDGEKNGRIILKETYTLKCKSIVLEGETFDTSAPRTRWVANGAWVFTKDEGKLLNMIPKYE